MISSNVFLCLVKLAFPVGLFRPFSFIFSLFIHFLFLTRVNSSRFNSTWLFFYFAFSRPLFAHSSLFNDVSPIMLKCFIQPIMALFNDFFSFVLLSFACLFQLRHLIYNSTWCSHGFSRLVWYNHGLSNRTKMCLFKCLTMHLFNW